MMISHFFNPTLSSLSGLLSNSTNDSNDETGPGVVWDRQAYIGVACLASAFIALTTAFCVFSKRAKKVYTCQVTLKKDLENSPWLSYEAPALKLTKALTPTDLRQIELIGAIAFVKNDIRKYLIERISNHENIEQDSLLHDVLHTMMKEKLDEEAERIHDHTMEVTVSDYEGDNPSRGCFERILPPLTQATIFFEITFGAIQTIGVLGMAPKILPISDTANFALNVSLVSFSTLNILIEILVLSASQRFMSSYGASMDNYLRNKWRNLPCRKKRNIEAPAMTFAPTCIEFEDPYRTKRRIAKGFLSLFMLVRIYTDVTEDYQSTMSINTMINLSGGSLIPAWLLYSGAMIEFGLNQLNDPVQFISMWTISCSVINMYFQKKTDQYLKAKRQANANPLDAPETRIVVDAEIKTPSRYDLAISTDGLKRYNQFARLSADSSESENESNPSTAMNTPLIRSSRNKYFRPTP